MELSAYRRESKGEQKRAAMLDAAERLFFEKGYLETPLQELLDLIGCSKGNFYHYFPTKLDVLTALCRARAQFAFSLYEKERVQTLVQRLNALLYYALPFRDGEEDFLRMLAKLRGGEENAACYGAWMSAQREAFKPELSRLLCELREAGTAYFTRPALPDLLWEAHAAFMIEAISALYRKEGAQRRLLDVIEAARFTWERLLDLPYGAVEIVRLPETLAVAARVAGRLRE